MKVDSVIDSLIKPPVQRFVGFDWSHTEKLIPTGAAERAKVLAALLSPKEPCHT